MLSIKTNPMLKSLTTGINQDGCQIFTRPRVTGHRRRGLGGGREGGKEEGRKEGSREERKGGRREEWKVQWCLTGMTWQKRPWVPSFHCPKELSWVRGYFQWDDGAGSRCCLVSSCCWELPCLHSPAPLWPVWWDWWPVSCSLTATVRLLSVCRANLAVDTMQRDVFFPDFTKQLTLIHSQPQREFPLHLGSQTGSSTDNSHYGQD